MTRIALLIAALLNGCPAGAWESGVDGGLCTLTHTEGDVAIRLTYDPGVPLYTITLARPDPWPVTNLFSMQFSGARPNRISTERHVLSPDRTTLSVSDRGFGNVLDGLQFNDTATGTSGGASVTVGLEGAAPAVAEFRACGQAAFV